MAETATGERTSLEVGLGAAVTGDPALGGGGSGGGGGLDTASFAGLRSGRAAPTYNASRASGGGGLATGGGDFTSGTVPSSPSPSPPSSPRSNPPGPDIKVYNIETEEINNLADDPKKEKIKKLAKNCSQGNKELCGWIMHKFGKIKEANPKGYDIILGYECNATTKAKKSNKPIFGIITKQTESKKQKEIPVPKSCGDCVVPTVWRNNGEEKCFNMSEKIKPIHFCVKPCKEYLFQIFILSAQRYNNETLNGYENAQNYELLNRIGQIMKPKLFWIKPIDKQIFKVNELSLNLSKININFPVFSDFLDLNKGSQEKVRNLLMTPEIIEFYVENPGLVTREVKQLLIALSDCYDVAKRYTGIFCKVAIDDEKISGYGGGGSDIIEKASQKLLKEKKMGRFNEELNVDNGCGGGGGGQKIVPFKRLTTEDLKENSQHSKDLQEAIQESLNQNLSENLDILLLEQDKLNKHLSNIKKFKDFRYSALISDLEKRISNNENTIKKLLDKKIKTKPKGDKITDAADIPLFFFNYANNSCWIDSLIYFLYGPDAAKKFYFFSTGVFDENFRQIQQYIEINPKMYGVIGNIWNNEFLQTLFFPKNNYKRSGYNDPADVLSTILEIWDIIGNQNQVKPDGFGTQSSQLILSAQIPNITDQIEENFFKSTYKYSFNGFPQNILLQSPTTGRAEQHNRNENYTAMKKLILPEIKVNEFPKDYSEPQRQATYKLISFLVNLGDGIHYVCYFLRNSQWWKYDDSNLEHKFELISGEITNLNIISNNNNSQLAKIVLYNYIFESEEYINSPE